MAAAAALISTWLCSNGANSKLVRIVHPSGHIELHDGPVRAAEIILRNPNLCLTHSQSSHHPWAIVSPDTTLVVGRKYYLFPENTVGNLPWPSPSPSTTKENGDLESDCFNGGNCLMCLFVSKEKGIGISCRGRSECGEDLEGENRRGVFLQNGNIRGSPQRSFASSHNWQPNLNSISEQY